MSGSADQLPDDRKPQLKRGKQLAVLTLAYLCSTVALLIVAMGGSQALKTEFVGDALSMIPPVLFLVGDRISGRPPSERYPYGFARAVSAAYLGAGVVLLATGGYLLFDGGMKLVRAEHPTLGGVTVFGHTVWLGWIGVGVLLWSSIPALFLGRAKQKAALALHDKVLAADAKINAADWQSASAAIIGVLGIAAGVWWLDALAGCLISVEVIRSGLSEIRSAIGDLLDRRPEKLEGKGFDSLPEDLTAFFKDQPWIADAVVRVREEGRQFTGEVFVVPIGDQDLVRRIEEASRQSCTLDWRLKEMLITPVSAIPAILEPVRADKD
jgi:cation diffusion facilitator family transporter